MWSLDFGSVQQFCCKWITTWKTRQDLLKWLAYNYYSHRDAGRSLLLRKREVLRDLASDVAGNVRGEAAPLQAAISPPPYPLLGSGLRPGTVQSWSQAPIGRCLLWRHDHDENWWSDTLISLSEEAVKTQEKSRWIRLPQNCLDLGSSFLPVTAPHPR